MAAPQVNLGVRPLGDGKRMAESITHTVFGELRWDQKYAWWFAQVRLPSAEQLDVIVNPGDEDRFAFIEPAAKLYRRAMKAERRILRDANRFRFSRKRFGCCFPGSAISSIESPE